MGLPPGDATDAQMDAAAALSDQFSHGELRVSHDQNLLLPWVRESDLPALYAACFKVRPDERELPAAGTAALEN